MPMTMFSMCMRVWRADRLMTKSLGALLLGFSALTAGQAWAQDTLTTVPSVDLRRYLGSWVEIAKYPNKFQKKCVSDTRAHYSAQADGTLRVLNRCTQQDGQTSEAVGQARQIGGTTSPKLEVRFAPAWLSFLPWVWGNYWVIDLDADYQLVAVSEPKREYLWVLSRTPAVNPQAYEALLGRLEKKGFDLSKLEKSKQTQP